MLNLSENTVTKFIKTAHLESFTMLSKDTKERMVARWLIFLLFITIIIFFLPWRQNIRGYGKVTSFRPQDRPQSIPSVIPGRIQKWNVQEGQFVQAGDTILVLAEIKDEYFDPQTINLNKAQIGSKGEVLQSMHSKLIAQDNQIDALLKGLELSLSKAKNKINQSILKVNSDSMDLKAAMLDYDIAEKQLQRQEQLYKEGLKSLTELEQRKLKFQETAAKLISAENKYMASKAELMNAKIEVNSITADYSDKISKARSERNSTEYSLFNTEVELSKMKNYTNNLELRSAFYIIRAPQNGYIVKTLKAGLGEIVKDGENICTIMPEKPKLAVELYADAIDIPFIHVGDEVRCVFEGFPVLQISGWPNVAIGTFKGRVSVIDKVISQNGKFRYLVTDEAGEPWPPNLGQGSGVFGFTLMGTVPVWFEIWRKLNGFPPNLVEEETAQTTNKSK